MVLISRRELSPVGPRDPLAPIIYAEFLRFKEEVNDLFDSGGLLLVARGQLLGARAPIFSTKDDPGVVSGWPREHHCTTDAPKGATDPKE